MGFTMHRTLNFSIAFTIGSSNFGGSQLLEYPSQSLSQLILNDSISLGGLVLIEICFWGLMNGLYCNKHFE